MKKQGKKNRFLLVFLIKLAIFAMIIYLVLTFVITFYRASSNNMFPNIKDGDLCVLYRLDEYHMGDIVYYKNSGKKKLGRIVATPGQEIDFPKEGGYLLNGFVPSEEILYQTYKSEASETIYPHTVSAGSFFIMNDFRSDAKDSREMGDVKKDAIIGKVIYVFRRRGF